MTSDQLRHALGDLDGTRDVQVHFEHAEECLIANALLVPLEEDRIIKMTDGVREYLVDAHRVAWIEIGPRLLTA